MYHRDKVKPAHVLRFVDALRARGVREFTGLGLTLRIDPPESVPAPEQTGATPKYDIYDAVTEGRIPDLLGDSSQ